MNTRTKTAASKASAPAIPVAINTLIDVLGALASDTMENNIYLVDSNKAQGSTQLGTGQLHSSVQVGDIVRWTVESLEPEAFATITAIEIDSSVIDVTMMTYPGSDVTYWQGKVKKKFETLPYQLQVLLGTQTKPMQADTGMALVCKA